MGEEGLRLLDKPRVLGARFEEDDDGDDCDDER